MWQQTRRSEMVKYPITLSKVTSNGENLRQSASFQYNGETYSVFHDFSPKEINDLKKLDTAGRKTAKLKVFKSHIKERINQIDAQPKDTTIIGEEETGDVTI